jgi:hypothetical protein
LKSGIIASLKHQNSGIHFLSFSPDNNKLVFDASPDGKLDIYTINLDGSNLTRLTFNGTDSGPNWSPFPFSGVKGFSASINIQSTPESPSLISPIGDPRLETRRPSFEWKALKGVYKDFKATWAKNGSFSDPTQIGESPLRQENIHGTTKPEDPTHVYFGYSIPYIDPALELYPTRYQWKVTALPVAVGSAVESNIENFSCEPDLDISGITNYPNPFNPNKGSTNIRYKLSKDADDVKIRIYDITGALVVELYGDTQGEGSTIMTKYNDVDWDGHNGRGDMVMNGIYPFEIVARAGNKTVSGRGKIAVLK